MTKNKIMSLSDWILSIFIAAIVCAIVGSYLIVHMIRVDQEAKCEVQRDVVVYEKCMDLPKDVKKVK